MINLKMISNLWGIKMTYGALGASFIAFENYSVFLFFFAILVELFFMVLIYLIFHIKKIGFTDNIINIIGGAAFISVTAYFLAYFAASEFDLAELIKSRTSSDFMLPVKVYAWSIGWLVLGLVVSYIQCYQYLKVEDKPLVKIQARLIRHVFSLYGVGFILAFVLSFFYAPEYRFLVLILPLSRIALDYYLPKIIADH